MSALPVGLVEIPAKGAKILVGASDATKSTLLEITRRKSKTNILVNHAIHIIY